MLIHTAIGLEACKNPDSVRMCNPSHLRGEAFDMVLFFLEDILRHEERESAILYSNALDLFVEPGLDLFPYEIRGRLFLMSSGTCMDSALPTLSM